MPRRADHHRGNRRRRAACRGLARCAAYAAGRFRRGSSGRGRGRV
jgi:hypothetical protein